MSSRTSSPPQLLVVGAGIVGLAHAVAGLRRGWRVTVIERHPSPRGASTQNFGLVWPIGQALGPDRRRALRSRALWEALHGEAGFSLTPTGSLFLAYHDDARTVLQECIDLAQDEECFELLPARTIAQLYPTVRRRGLQAGLFSRVEARVEPVATLAALVRWLAGQGVSFHFGRPVTRVYPDAAETSDGTRHAFDRLVVCCGDEVSLLFPDRLAVAGGETTHLHMARTTPMPPSWRLTPALASELTLPHYPVFADCPTLPALRARLQEEYPHHAAYGIHVLAVQEASGALVVGDSHTPDAGVPPTYRNEIETLIVGYLGGFLETPPLQMTDRWLGRYLKPPAGLPFLQIDVSETIQIVTGLGGAGMTLSFAVAEETLDAAGDA